MSADRLFVLGPVRFLTICYNVIVFLLLLLRQFLVIQVMVEIVIFNHLALLSVVYLPDIFISTIDLELMVLLLFRILFVQTSNWVLICSNRLIAYVSFSEHFWTFFLQRYLIINQHMRVFDLYRLRRRQLLDRLV